MYYRQSAEGDSGVQKEASRLGFAMGGDASGSLLSCYAGFAAPLGNAG